MINDLDNKISLNVMSDLEHDKNALEMMRYRVNRLSYVFGFLGVFFSVLGGFIGFNSFNPETWMTILKIVINLAILLFGFLYCEKAKNYSTSGSIGLIVLSVVCIARVFWIPMLLLTGSSIGRTVTDISGGVAWLPQSANLRAGLMVGFLIAASLFMIIAGVIGYIRSTRLKRYLSSISDNINK